jgi:preprotein translocase subunit SecA
MSLFKKIFGDPNQKVIRKLQPLVNQINALENKVSELKDEDFKIETERLKAEVKNGKSLNEVLPMAFALVREANKRKINVRHFDVQLIGGIVLHQGQIAEMKTGEGKTHVASLPLYLNALEGKGCHLITVNDYLAKRDSGWNGPANFLLGMTTGCITHESGYVFDPNYEEAGQEDRFLKHLRPVDRKVAYASDIVYGTNNEFGFDYLRDNMVNSLEQKVQGALNFCIIDEVDSILIDEARTPLIISAPAQNASDMYYKYAKLVEGLIEDKTEKKKSSSPFYMEDKTKVDENDPNLGDYNKDEKMRSATFTDKGVDRLAQMLGRDPWKDNDIKTVFHLESALKAKVLFHKDKDYIVKDGEVVIIDEFTGRMMVGRRYSEGVHQAIEAKEHARGELVEVNQESQTLATISFQNLFRMYKKLAGMTGTAITEAEEFFKIYKLEVVEIPTNKPVLRNDLTDLIYKNELGKFNAIVAKVKELHEKGQPVLIGTISIEKNELLSKMLERNGIAHQLLNAKHHEKEAHIVAQAGKFGAVTLATNMAGRGVDIKLGGDPINKEDQKKIKDLGGLYIIGTERHESRRIDNQLRGRGGRQGDEGASRFYVSMEDDLMRIFGSERMKSVMERLGVPDDMPIENKLISRSIESAQKKVEGYHFDSRKRLVEYDDVMNKHRESVYKKRNEILLQAENSHKMIMEMVESEIEQVVSFHTSTDWNINEVYEVVHTIFPIEEKDRLDIKKLENEAGTKIQDVEIKTKLLNHLGDLAKKQYADLEKDITQAGGNMRNIEKGIMLRTIDELWIEHLDNMEHLRTGIGLRGYGQKDPLVEYKREGYILFNELQNNIQKQIVYNIYKAGANQKIQSDLLARQNINFSAPEKIASQLSSIMKSMMGNPASSAKESQKDSASVIAQKPKNEEGEKIGRNDLCHCGSGKKYKKCCGQ